MKKPLSWAVLVLFLFFGYLGLASEELDITIRFIGLKMADVSIINRNNKLEIGAKSTSLASIAASLHNRYVSEYDGDFLTRIYTKIIDQKDYKEDRTTYFDQKNRTANRISRIKPEINTYYNIEFQTRDFFSALFYLRYQPEPASGTMHVDANTIQWKCYYNFIGKEKIRTFRGKKECIKYSIRFTKIGLDEPARSDMLTNNLVNEKIELIFWFTDDELRLPVKAKFLMNPFPVVWVLEKTGE